MPISHESTMKHVEDKGVGVLRVLVVEDERKVATALKEGLERDS